MGIDQLPASLGKGGHQDTSCNYGDYGQDWYPDMPANIQGSYRVDATGQGEGKGEHRANAKARQGKKGRAHDFEHNEGVKAHFDAQLIMPNVHPEGMVEFVTVWPHIRRLPEHVEPLLQVRQGMSCRDLLQGSWYAWNGAR